MPDFVKKTFSNIVQDTVMSHAFRNRVKATIHLANGRSGRLPTVIPHHESTLVTRFSITTKDGTRYFSVTVKEDK